MRLLRLSLHAFGPFTEQEIVFDDGRRGGGADLHLIYGPNEAGKSSALRAMTDLRFGIPLRSADGFLHPAKDLRVAGVFADADAGMVGLLRRKGRKSTLMLFDPRDPVLRAGAEAGPGHERALTGGLTREEFEAMFGLNHARLREGGDRLVKGEGELGAALFEASAGTQGIAAILTSLDEDAKALFSPRSRNAVINEARRALDEHRRAWKAAQTRPAEWQQANRAHQQARAALADIRRALEIERRRENELTELRTVGPLLRDHDRALIEARALDDAPDLPENAREERLRAEQALARAQQDIGAARQALTERDAALDALRIETPLLEHAAAIDRLAGAVEAAQRSRIEVRQQRAAIEQLTETLHGVAARIDPDRLPPEILAALPSDAELAAIDRHLAAIPVLTDRLTGYRERSEALQRATAQEKEAALPVPDAAARRRVEDALALAQGLGDPERQQAELDREASALAIELEQALSDLAVDSVAALRRSRPLLDAQIDAAAARFDAMQAAMREFDGEADRTEAERMQLTARRRELAAAGEVVTAETLERARQRRDQGWALVRRAYVERSDDPAELGRSFDPGRSLADAFEIAQQAADRRADLLRADAARAASFEECDARLAVTVARRQALDERRADLVAARQQVLEEWNALQTAAGLPALDPPGLREWQDRRATALDLAGRRDRLNAERARLATARAGAADGLATALRSVGEATASPDLASLIGQAARWARRATSLQGRREERAAMQRARREENRRLERNIRDAQAELQRHHDGVGAWLDRLSLAPDTPAPVVKARLDELDGLARRAAELSQATLHLAQQQGVLDDFQEQARVLARLLDEPAPASPDDFAERLRRRLRSTLENEQRRLSLVRERARVADALGQACAERERQSAVLAGLCAAAGVGSADQLAGCEERAARKRELRATLAAQREQLTRASTRPEAELRERLDGRDTIGLDSERGACRDAIERLEGEQTAAGRAEEAARRALEAIDASDAAARAREAMESAAARYRSAIRPWARLRLAHALLAQSLQRFRERAQAPMIAAASRYFALMTDGRYPRLLVNDADDRPLLLAERTDAVCVGVDAMSEGTADQLYLALRLAALELRRDSHPQMPLVLDDVLVTSDDQRAGNVLRALSQFADGGQVVLFTHHRHVLDLARRVLGEGRYTEHQL